MENKTITNPFLWSFDQVMSSLKDPQGPLGRMIQYLKLAVWRIDLTEGRCDISNDWFEMHGLSATENPDITVFLNMLIHPEDKASFIGQYTEHLEGRREILDFSSRRRHPQKEWIFVRTLAIVAARDENGRPLSIVGFDQDTTEIDNALKTVLRHRRYLNVLKEMRKSFALEDEREILGHFLECLSHQFGFAKAWFGILNGTVIEPVLHAGPLRNLFDMDLLRVSGENFQALCDGGFLPPEFHNDSPARQRDSLFPLHKAILESRTVLVNSAVDHHAVYPWHSFLRQSGFRSILAIPFVLDGQTDGGFVLYSMERYIDASDVFVIEDSILELERIILKKRHFNRQQEVLSLETKKAEAATKAKTVFLANISHEIRTPMTAILGYSEMIVESVREHWSDAVRRSAPEASSPANAINASFMQFLESTTLSLRTSAHDLLALLGDIIDITMIESKRVDIQEETVDVREMLQSVCASLRQQAEEKRIGFLAEIEENIPPVVFSDGTRLKQILVNLGKNAIKFTTEGQITLRASWSEELAIPANLPSGAGMPPPEYIAVKDFADRGTEPAGCLRFDMVDTGIGIREEYFMKLFEPFFQVDESITREFGGTGIGLSLSKQIVQLLGGVFYLRSVVGKGSTFSVMIPVRLPEDIDRPAIRENKGLIVHAENRSAPTPPPPGPPKSRLRLIAKSVVPGSEAFLQSSSSAVARHIASPDKGKEKPLVGVRLLLVEDGVDNQRILSLLLSKAGADVTIAENGMLACKFVVEDEMAGNPFDLVLMDVQMPIMDGYTATKYLRERGFSLPIIALTAHALQEEKTQCLSVGCDDFASKPILKDDLITKVKTALSL